MGPSQHQPGAGRTTTSRRRSGDISPPSPAPILGAASPAPAPRGHWLPAPSGRRPSGRARRPSRVSASLALPPPTPSLEPGASTSPRPPGHSSLLPSFLRSLPPSRFPAPGTQRRPPNWPADAGRCALSLPGSDSPPAPAPRCSLVRLCAAPPPPGTRSLRAPGDGSDLSSSTSYSSGCSGAGSASLEVGGADSPTGGAVAVAAQTPSSGPGPPSGPDALAVPGFGHRTRVARVQAGREGRSGAVKLRKSLAALAIPMFPSPNSRRPWSSRTLGHPTS